ncbi:MAG: hypothetical protein M3R64_04295 [Pseudomonadota bacterium]|nr:hypothetical protein [Pseudomonadota bacterium]
MIMFPAAMAVATACQLPAGWDAVEARHTPYVVFGEVHGSSEAPDFVGETACALARRGDRILVAIEQRGSESEALQRVWRLPHPGFTAALRALPMWAGRNDGVGSEAMFALLVRLHALSASGKRIDIVAFDGPKDDAQRARFGGLPGQGVREASQAANIRTAASLARYDRVLVLTGNAHARLLPVRFGQSTYDAMAMHLASRGQITSLDLRADAGTSWNCQMSGRPEPGKPIDASQIKCEPFPYSGSNSPGGKPRIVLGATDERIRFDPAYDGFFFVGRVTASPPLVR